MSATVTRAAAVYLLISAPVYLLFMVRVVRPTLAKLVTARMQEGEQGVTTRGAVVVGAATIASALATDLMGLHFIIGAFLVGAIIARQFALSRSLIACRS